MKKILVLIVLAAVIGFGAYIYFGSGKKTAITSCGFTVNSPLPESTVTFPLSISATVDNTNSEKLGCSWTIFEAQAGLVKIKDAQGTTLAIGALKTTADWATSAAVPYTATITSLSNPSYVGPLEMIFTEENPSDKPSPKTLTIPVKK